MSEEIRNNGMNVGIVAEPTGAYAATSFDTVISYLHSSHLPIETKRAVYLQLQAEVADENLGYMKRRLKEFANLQLGWDGEDAQPVLPEITSFMDQLLRSCSGLELSDWALFPNVNGTFLLQRNNAAISIGLNEYSYFAEANNKVMGLDHQPLTIESVKSTIESINRYV
jgi:hypothetical protein